MQKLSKHTTRPDHQRAYDHRDIDIILLGLFRWDGPYSSISIAMAKEFARHNRLFYINHPYSVRDYFRQLDSKRDRAKRKALRRREVRYEKDEKAGSKFLSVTPPMTLPINWLPAGGVYAGLAKFNSEQIGRTLRQLIHDFKIGPYIFINCFDPFYSVPFDKSFAPLLNIYQCVDDISQDVYTEKHGLRLEEEAIRHADLTLVTSQELFRLKSPLTQQIHVLNNAVDIDNFHQALTKDYPKPDKLKQARQPIIGYIGNLDAVRVDYQLLYDVATAHTDKTLVLVGPINNEQYKKLGLDRLPNVLFTGGMPIEALPAYLKYMDCCIIPFACNTLTRSIYPLKINEYLAAGKPVVATNFSADIGSFSEHIYLAGSSKEFAELIHLAVDDSSPEKIAARVAVARQNTWTARIEQFWNIVDQYL